MQGLKVLLAAEQVPVRFGPAQFNACLVARANEDWQDCIAR